MRKRILSIWLSVCMVLTMLPISAMAEEADASIGTSGEIIAFAPLAETEKLVPTGTALEDLGLPKTLTATVRTAVTADSGVSEEPVQDSGNPDNLTEPTPGVATSTDSGEQAKAGETTEPEWKITTPDIPVTWTSEYDMDDEGVYVFTPVIEGYTVSAALPQIAVTVGAAKRQMLRTASGAPASNPTKSIADSNLYFKDNSGDTQYSTDNTTWTSYTGEFTITGSSTSDTDAAYTVIVKSGTHNITLSDCSIGAATATGIFSQVVPSPFDIQGGTVNLTLTGENKLYSLFEGRAGLHVSPGASLVVTAKSTGSLDARCHKNNTNYGRGAGIGGDNTGASGTISINGGEVSAYSFNGAGIGNGNKSGAFGDIRITGGTVVAQSDNGNGIGLGNANTGTVGNVTITGGSVKANSKTSPIGGTLKNDNGNPVQLYTLTLSGVSSATAVEALSTTPVIDYVYGTSGMKTDDGGKLYVYLPAEQTAADVTTEVGIYSGTISANVATLQLPQAQWGVAGSGGTEPTDWTQGTLTEAISYANSLASGKAYIQLLSDVNINAALDFVSGKTTILDLNGKDIDRGLTTATLDGIVINVRGSLTLKDSSTGTVASQGKITGGYSKGPGSTYAYTGGGVNVNASASFTMQGGNITGNKTTNSGSGGGGVYVALGGGFMMTGGSIANNEALNWGGGVYTNGGFTILGGSITGNQSLNGGVYFSSSPLTVGGTAVIDDNMVTSSAIERNVVRYGYTISVHSATPLTTGASIGVTANTAPTSGNPVNVTGTNSNDYSSYFHSDNSSYMIQNGASNIVQLAVAAPVIGTLSIPGSFTAGSTLTLSELDSKYTPTITNNGVTITAQGWQIPVYPDSWTNWSVGGLPLDTSGTFKLRYYATYAGGTIYSNEVTLTVVGKTTALTLTAMPDGQQVAGNSVTLTATLTGFFAGPGVNGQTITFKNGGTILGTASLNSSGVAAYTWTPDTGTYSLTAEYAATPYNTAATSSAVNYTVIVDPDIAIVAGAKTAAQGASYANMTQTAATDEDAIETALKNTAATAVNNSDITISINKVSYTAPIVGTSANPGGTNGSYTFTVTVSKGSQSETTEQKTIAITATAYTGTTDAQAVAAAKTALVDGIVNVAFGASLADKTAAVQAYVNGLLTGDAIGVTATVTYNNGTEKYDVAISKGSVNDSKSLSMTVNVAPDPDIAIVAGAKTAAQGASYANMTQTAATDEDAIETALKNTAATAVNNSDITISINKVSYTAPIVGTSANPGGTNGSYTFTVTVSKGTQSETTEQKTIVITATAYTGITDAQAVAAAKTALVDGSVNVAFGASLADKTAAVQAYVNGLLTGDAAGVTATVTYNSSTGKYDVAISKGSVNDSKSLSMTVNVAPDPDIAIVAGAKTAAQGASYANMTQADATDEDIIKTALKFAAETAISNSGITVTINKASYTAPIAGTSANPGGTNGSYTFTVTVSKGSQSETTEQKTIVITATAYTGITDAQAVAAAKTALVDGSVNVPFGASLADKTAAVQAYVNALLTGDAVGVTATVTYNSDTKKYDVTISKGSVNDSKSLSMTVNIAPDPDIAIVVAAKTAAQSASYANMTQTAAADEGAIETALKNTAATAVNNSDITITINKVSYTAPIAGTSANPGGTNGSYTFTVTVSKGTQSETTEQKTIVITATAYTGITDAQAVAAAKTALVDGTVNVAFGASEADKTAAVQAYVNGLLTGDAAGVTATVTYNSDTKKYDVTISKGSVNDSKSLFMTVNVAPDPDIAIVSAAKTAAQSASYANMTQTAAADEDAIETALKNAVVAAVNNSGVIITINKVGYTAPIAGTFANPGGTNGSYTFTVTVSKGSQSETTEQKTITITATAYTGGTGGNGNAGSGSDTPSKPVDTKPTESVTGSTENKATVDNKGNASVSLTDKNITDAIADAKAEAAKKGVNAGDITAVIHATTGGKNANTVTVNLPKTTQEQVIGNKISSVQLVIDRPDLTIGIDLAAVTEINRQAKADVQLLATRMKNSKLSGDAKAAIGNRPTYALKATYGSGKSVSNFGRGSVSVEIPYSLQKGEVAGNVYVVYVDAKGKVTYLTDSSYDAKRGTVVFSTNHFSTYGIAYKASSKFTDIKGHWAKNDILFVANRGLMTGTRATTFNPNGFMTRGMFITVLGRLANADISAYKQSNFSDVKANAYYMGYIEWGVKNNILTGIGDGKFDPNGLVTREQMAVIMDRYVTAIGFKLPQVHAQNVFADNAKISASAAPSVKRLQMAGIIQGKSKNLYDPQGTATRAEVAAVLHRFVELTIFDKTAKGWVKNDSGKWMYYENGKPVTGKKDIGGTTYTFDQYGVTTDVLQVPKK